MCDPYSYDRSSLKNLTLKWPWNIPQTLKSATSDLEIYNLLPYYRCQLKSKDVILKWSWNMLVTLKWPCKVPLTHIKVSSHALTQSLLCLSPSSGQTEVVDVVPTPPEFVRQLQSVSVQIGQEVHLSCQVASDTEVTVIWMRDSEEVAGDRYMWVF